MPTSSQKNEGDNFESKKNKKGVEVFIKNKQLGEIAKISFVLKFDDSNC